MPKPVRKKKRFIDRHRDGATTFSVVHRSQRDPLAADHDAPQRVLRPINEDGGEDGGDGLDRLEARREEQRKFGVYFDDDYDYLQHLRGPGEVDEVELEEVDRVSAAEVSRKGTSVISAASDSTGKLKLPSSVFQSDFEEKVGLLNRAAPQSGPLVGLDPEVLEVLETLDDAYEVEEVLHRKDLATKFEQNDCDDASDEEEVVEVEEGDLDDILADIIDGERAEEPDAGDGRDTDEFEDEDSNFGFDNDEMQTKFTEYSMSSSVVPRTEQMATLDDKFEKFFDEYEEENTGALDMDEIEGHRAEDSDVMKQIIREYEQDKAEERQKLAIHLPEEEEEEEGADDSESGDDSDEEEKDLVEVEAPREKWDCESIISTYSNLYHHPKLISEPSKKPIQISSKTGIPKDVLGKGLTASALRQLDQETGAESGGDLETATLASRVSELSVRNKHETLEEKRERKAAFREHRRERREEKKANKKAFSEERTRQHKADLNNRMNIQGQHLL